MNVALVSMPWGDFGTPSAALGALSGFLHENEPNFEVTCYSEHLEVSERIGSSIYGAICDYRVLAESLYLAALFPEQRKAVRAAFGPLATSELGGNPETLGIAESSWEVVFDQIHEVLTAHLKEAAAVLSRQADVVGLTTSLAQIFSSLALAQQIKTFNPTVRIVLGGASVYGMPGLSVVQEFAFVDYVIQGEGEEPFTVLLRALDEGREVDPATPGIITRAAAERPLLLKRRWEAPDLDALPMPDYDEYAQKADRYSIIWNIPVEGSRGCWWDRAVRTGNPRKRCHFCNYAACTYREKNASRVAGEVDFLARRYQNVRFTFCDNAVRPRGVKELAGALKKRRKQLCFFMAVRANIVPRDILSLHQAGMVRCECGIEGLSNSFLKRINKGTTVIKNLQVLKTCHELGIWNVTNLITEFPGATAAEVEETANTIRNYAAAYYPSGKITSFDLCVGCTVDVCREEYGINRVRNCDDYRCGMPEQTWTKLQLTDQSWDGPEPVNWSPVQEACVQWHDLHEQLRKDKRFPFTHPVYYHDGGEFLEIVDRRHGCRTLTLPEPWRSVYLFCMEIRNRDQLNEYFPEYGSELDSIIERLVDEKVLYREGQRYLSLAVAATPELAARRIRAASRRRPARQGPSAREK
jgi:ribosomal peptide maturation radical SAM protein 1